MTGVGEARPPESVVLLHGFSGTRRAWDRVLAELDPQRLRAVALDLPGHGEIRADGRGGAHGSGARGGRAAAGDPITFDACVERVLAGAPARFALCGYSMGARIALHVALAAPERVSRLVLIGVNPGLEDADERALRREADERLARSLERDPFEEWIERWREQPLFDGESPDVRELARADQRRNDPLRLAAALRSLGTGEMAPLWDALAQLEMPVVLIAGTRDEKFLAIARRMATLIPRAQLVLLDGGHALALEQPAAVAAVLAADEPARTPPAGAPAPAR